MPLTDTSGVILRMTDWSETSAIVTWFTRDYGKLRTVAKGAHRTKSPFSGKLDQFYLDDIVFVFARRSELHTLSECFVENPFPHIRERLEAYTIASYCCDLVDIATEPEGPVPQLFELLTTSLCMLDAKNIPSLFVPRFELLALEALGLRPEPTQLNLDPGTCRIVTDLLDGVQLERLRISKPQAYTLNACLMRFIGQQFGRLPKSRRLISY